jgi:hypothetical protein
VGDVTIDRCHTLDQLTDMLHEAHYVSPEQAEAERLEQEREANRARALKMKEKRNKHKQQ